MSKGGIRLTAAFVAEHQAKHGFSDTRAQEPPGESKTQRKPPTPVKMTRPEKQYDLILLALKSRDEIKDYKFQGMSLAWGADPRTGRLMRYKSDFVVFPHDGPIRIIEVKGQKVTQEGMARFKGCRSEWPMFLFEMHQLTQDGWRRIQ